MKTKLWILGTAFFGLIFIGFQAYEFTEFYGLGLTLTSGTFGSTFFTLTGFQSYRTNIVMGCPLR